MKSIEQLETVTSPAYPAARAVAATRAPLPDPGPATRGAVDVIGRASLPKINRIAAVRARR